MDDRGRRLAEEKAKVFKALGHPSRVFIVEQLGRGERCVCELVAMIGADFSTVSKHLSVLKQAGIVDDDKRGQQVFYRLRMACALGFMGCVEGAIADRARADAGLVMTVGA